MRMYTKFESAARSPVKLQPMRLAQNCTKDLKRLQKSSRNHPPNPQKLSRQLSKRIKSQTSAGKSGFVFLYNDVGCFGCSFILTGCPFTFVCFFLDLSGVTLMKLDKGKIWTDWRDTSGAISLNPSLTNSRGKNNKTTKQN